MESAITRSEFTDGFARMWYELLALLGRPFSYNKELNFEKRINVTLAGQKEKFKPTEKNVRLFCDTVGDDNPLHHDDAYAQSLSFERRIVPGTQINANLEQFVEGTVGILNKSLNDFSWALNFARSSIHFPNPLYPGDSVRWQVTNYKVGQNEIELEIAGADKKREIVVPQIKAMLSRTYPEPQTMPNPEIFTREFSYAISKESLDNYLEATGDENSGTVPWSYPIALVTSALLDISRGRDGRPTGINNGMKFDFYKRPELADVDVRVFLAKEPVHLRRIGQYKYNFRAECTQNNNQIIQGAITVVSEKRL